MTAVQRSAARLAGWGIAAVLVLASCGGAKRVDVQGVERTITEKLGAAYPSARITDTSCPSKPTFAADSSFRCTTRVDDQPLGVTVVLTDTKGGLTFTTDRVVVVTDQVEADLRTRLHAAYDEPGDRVAVTVQCPGRPIRLLDVGASFRCRVVVDGSAMPQEAVVADRRGGITFRSVD